MKWERRCVTAFCLLICLAGFACGGRSTDVPGQEAPVSYQNFKLIQQAYLAASQALGHPPQNASELMPYLHGKMEADKATLLLSPDDGEEYKILWGVDALQPRMEDGKFPIIAYEQRGKEGTRYVMDGGHIRRMTDEQLKNAPWPPGHRAPE
jgi:hypothetical protein